MCCGRSSGGRGRGRSRRITAAQKAKKRKLNALRRKRQCVDAKDKNLENVNDESPKSEKLD